MPQQCIPKSRDKICSGFYSPRGNNGSIDTFVDFSSLKAYATAKTKIEVKGFFYGVSDGVKIKKL